MYDSMKKMAALLLLNAVIVTGTAQPVSVRLREAFRRFENDAQLINGIASLYVVNARTGAVAFQKNARIGLPSASTLKVITAATAYELLGTGFRYETQFGYTGRVNNRSLEGQFYLKASGDPTIGSWRWTTTSDTAIFKRIESAVKNLNISRFNGFGVVQPGWDQEGIPEGWIWQDIGNYYGAGSSGFNWRENQFDIVLKSGSGIGDPVAVLRTNPKTVFPITSVATAAAKGSGDNAYVFYPLSTGKAVIRGTIPLGENAFTISAADPDPVRTFTSLFSNKMSAMGVEQAPHFSTSRDSTILFTHHSPVIDSMIYWFLRKSINLYGEALVKTMAFKQNGIAETTKGVEIIQNFWKEKGIPVTELNLADGSGLSPLNRVTTHAQVRVLQYARTRPWFRSYFLSFPEYNGMKIKSGTIHDVKGFCGYHTSKDGTEWIFSFLVNNYNGSASSVVQKMYRVLDELKR